MEKTQIASLTTTPKSVKNGTPAKDADANFESKVRVVVRVRPFLPQEIAAKKGIPCSCVSVLDQDFQSKDQDVTVHLKDPDTSRNECYQLDSFFGQEDNNISRIFEKEVRPLIPGIFRGCNATVFAYGATGSGKTYTMQGSDELPGLMPLAMSTILSVCQKTGSAADISYYEVYMDRCYDLLEMKPKEIVILDDNDGQIHLRGLSQVPVKSMSEFREAFSCGIQRRKIAHTGLNDVSSRSHGVLVIGVSTPLGDGSGAVATGKLSLIDLAGNEDNRRTCNEGIRLQESATINKSLFALSNVIYALNNSKPRVPYRDSKLTRILQDSLGGTSRALMVACLNPGEYQESVHTISLAARSRHISNFVPSAHKLGTPKVKVDMEAKLQAWLESKGKTKSLHRTAVHGSPYIATSVTKSKFHSSAKAKVNSNRGASNFKNRSISVPFTNLFNDADLIDSCLESAHSDVDDNAEEVRANVAELSMELTTKLSVEPLDKEEKMTFTESNVSILASPVGEKKNAMRTPLREVLSAIEPNINCISSEKVASTVPLEPKTPKAPFGAFAQVDNAVGTPLDKFHARSSTLKSSLLREYIDVLNTASREELVEIKGIGQKLAEYIVELRETSPLKSLCDLEKIGLSSKQVYNMFNRAARGIFDRQGDATPCWSETLP